MRGEFVTIACRYRQTQRQDSHDKVEKHVFLEKSMCICYKWLGKHIICSEGICTPYADGLYHYSLGRVSASVIILFFRSQ